MAIVLASKPGLSSTTTLHIPKDWDPTWFRNFISNQLKGADVRNAVGANGVTVTGTIASPYATIGFGAPVTLPGPVTISGSNSATALTVNAGTGQIAITATGGPIYSAQTSGSSILLNATGQDFGSIFTSGTQSWSLGYALTASTASPTAALTWTQPGTVTITGNSTGVAALAVNQNAASNTWTQSIINSGSASGSNYGLLVEAGTTTADWAIYTGSKANAAQLFNVQGGGAVFFPSIGTTASAANATFVAGTFANSILKSTSSIRYKDDVQTLSSAEADLVLRLRPVTYLSKADADDKTVRWYGLIAEEVAAIAPRLARYEPEIIDYRIVDKGNHKEREPVYGDLRPDGVHYDRLPVLLLDVVQRLSARVAALETAHAAVST